MVTGEMFHEHCENESVDPTPRPVPDINKRPKYHYLPVAETPITNTDDGKRREVDDYHPWARSKQVHKKNEINIENNASVQTFCNRYIVEESLVKRYLEHLNHWETMSDKRKMGNKNKNLRENTMSYEEFDWMEMLNNGTLAKQRACVLENTSINIICLQWKVKTSHRKLMLLWITYGHLSRARKAPSVWKR